MKRLVIVLSLLSNFMMAQNKGVWQSDQGDGTYVNPILYSDFSDPDAVRVGEDYYMTASSFNCVPGLPILHSKDLVNWELINYALPRLVPEETFKIPQHGNGVWAPCIRYHKDEFYIYYPDPDFGIYMVKTKDPYSKWSEPVLVKSGKGFIDPTPLWDDDGTNYLAYAFAGSRAGIKSMLLVCTMNADGTKANEDDVMVFDGHDKQPTIEGPKFYKHNAYYYLFAPAGGVTNGWQLVLRSKNVYGPYESRVVMEQGKTGINGPHQGAWVQTQSGEDWFLHFQDKGAYGRIVHLQPMHWMDDWPVIGIDSDKDGIGNPVLSYKKPEIDNVFSIVTPPDSDEFNKPSLGLQWQWHANPEVYWGFPTPYGHYTMYCRPEPSEYKNLWTVPNLLLQKFPAEEFMATAKITFNARHHGERIGLLVMGRDYSYLQVKQEDEKLRLSQVTCWDAENGNEEVETSNKVLKDRTMFLRVTIKKGGICTFSYSNNNMSFQTIGSDFAAKEGKWIGAKIGFLALRNGITNDAGSMNIDWIRFSKNK